jgi:hypothetical protein
LRSPAIRLPSLECPDHGVKRTGRVENPVPSFFQISRRPAVPQRESPGPRRGPSARRWSASPKSCIAVCCSRVQRHSSYAGAPRSGQELGPAFSAATSAEASLLQTGFIEALLLATVEPSYFDAVAPPASPTSCSKTHRPNVIPRLATAERTSACGIAVNVVDDSPCEQAE